MRQKQQRSESSGHSACNSANLQQKKLFALGQVTDSHLAKEYKIPYFYEWYLAKWRTSELSQVVSGLHIVSIQGQSYLASH